LTTTELKSKPPPCSACGETTRRAFTTDERFGQTSKENFTYYDCKRCGLVFVDPIPANLGRYYGAAYAPYTAPSRNDLPRIAERERYKFALVQQFAPRTGRMLEIGPSFGAFAYLALNAGYSVDALEMDPLCCEYLKTIGVNATCTTEPHVEAAKGGPWDVVVMWHAIEHLIDPWRTLDVVASRIRPGGILVIATPNPHSIQYQLLGRYWRHLDAPRHLQLIPLDLLRKRLERTGVYFVHTTTGDAGGVILSRGGWQQSLMRCVSAPSARFGMRVLGRLVHVAMSPIERHTGLGAAYTAVFRRGAVSPAD
jgi:SAM-dependent methyltransferase